MNDVLPPPDVPDLPANRHRELKGAFMLIIDNEPGTKPSSRRWAYILAPAVAIAVAVVAVGVVSPRSTESHGDPAPIIAIDPGSAAELGPLVNRLALAAAGKPSTPVSSGQYVYIRSKVAWLTFDEKAKSSDGARIAGRDPMLLDKVHSREIWVPATAGDKGQIREHGDTFALQGARPNSYYASLPTNPGALLAKIYAVSGTGDLDNNDMAFDYVGETLRESILPPGLLAALYRAAAKIPGVVMVKDSVDAAGRHGVAVARTDSQGERTEWIFDPHNFDYLGERSYLVRDTPIGPAGMLTATTAVLERGVVAKKGRTP